MSWIPELQSIVRIGTRSSKFTSFNRIEASYDAFVTGQTVFSPLNNRTNWIRFSRFRMFRQLSPQACSATRSGSRAETAIDLRARIRCGARCYTGRSRGLCFKVREARSTRCSCL